MILFTICVRRTSKDVSGCIAFESMSRTRCMRGPMNETKAKKKQSNKIKQKYITNKKNEEEDRME